MILDDAPKGEFHLRLNAMRKILADFRDEKAGETELFIKDIAESEFIRDLVNIVAVIAQQLFATEIEKYHKCCQLLCDFYKLARSENLSENIPAPDKPALIPEQGDWSARVWQDEQTQEDGQVIGGKYEFPVLDELNEFAQKCIWKLSSQPSNKEPVATDAKKGAPANEDALPEPLCSKWVDYQQSILNERILFLEKVKQIHSWAHARLSDICACESDMYQDFRDMQKARELKQGGVEAEMLRLLHTSIESAKPVEFKMVLDNTQLQIVTKERIFPEEVPPQVLPKVRDVNPQWDSEELKQQVESFFEGL